MSILRLRVLAVFALGYFISFLFRGVNLGFAPFLSREIGLTATDLGTLTSIYFLGFAGAQIPAGVLLDRYGARRVTAGVLLFAAAGSLLFALSTGMTGLMIGRLLIGIGASICLGGAFKATAHHFPVSQLTLVNGIVMAIGGLGGVVVGEPLSLLLTLAHWRTVSMGLSALTACVALIIWFGAPATEATASKASLFEQFKGTFHVLRSHAFWKLATFSALTQAAFYAMQSLWVGVFLRDMTSSAMTNGASRIGTLISVLGGTFIVGNVCFGALARALERRGLSVQRFSGVTMAAFVVVETLLATRVALPDVMLWAAYGALGGTGILTYAVLAEHFPARLIGRVNTAFTLVIFVGIFVTQITIGAALNHWSVTNGHYPVAAHQYVWFGLIAVQVFAALWYFAPGKRKETHSFAVEL
ncbi:MFS transporter [Burkholderia sp. Ac-20365]|uniref:MFS transporter n=1 Tax=Burkholderia sp. Ac-20365 TaxID=2703897 RepID=UPI00197C26E3|nr:MFS transporter [Burkholderia sp. Ac-20365]MBN3761595.1 MFS transporter [Burkholderia sp. Ac-20365]